MATRATGFDRSTVVVVRLTEFFATLMAPRLQVYETDDIVVTFDPAICAHSGICVRGLPDVFDVQRKRWIRPELASAERVAQQVARCPSGALQVRWPEGKSGPDKPLNAKA